MKQEYSVIASLPVGWGAKKTPRDKNEIKWKTEDAENTPLWTRQDDSGSNVIIKRLTVIAVLSIRTHSLKA